MIKARIWKNELDQWEAHVPGDDYTFVDPDWKNTLVFVEIGLLHGRGRYSHD